MKLKLTWLLTLFMAFVMQFSFSQEKTVTGTITTADDGLPLPGASVIVKGTSRGQQTDFDGVFTITVSVGETLVVSYVGMKSTEILIGASNTYNVALQLDGALDEVVVTALGVERSAKSLGYGITTLKADEINEVRETSVLGALSGKSSGVVINQQSGNLGGSQRILIRGVSTLGGNQQPLFVIDGVPTSNANTATGSRITGGFDFGNRAQDINPDDIETISILKGASAAALYGSRAANGVVIINTKKGKTGSKASISVSSTMRFDDPLLLPDFQNEYAFGTQDADGVPVTDGTIPINDGNPGAAGWGERISDLASAGRTFIDYDGATRNFKNFKDNVQDFYASGVTNVNSIAIAGGGEEGNYRVSLSHNDQKGIVPGSRLNRTNIGINTGYNINEKLTGRTSINYVRTNTRGTAAAGANDPNVLSNIVNGLPRTANIDIFREYINAEGEQINPVGLQTNNPYWIAKQNAPTTTVQRFFGNTQLEWEPIQKLNILGRVGYDTFTDTRLIVNSIGTLGRVQGSFTDDVINSRELTLDLLVSYDWALSDDLSLNTRAGTQWNERVFERFLNTGTNLTVAGLYSPGNAEVNAPNKAFAASRIHGVFGDITLDYKNWAFLNVTGRNDWSSTLPVQNRSFFYPSVALSVVLSDALDIQSNTLSYLKFRTNWANVGNDTTPYRLDFNYTPDTGYFGQFGTGGNFPFDGQVTFNSDGVLADPNLVAQNQSNYEVGLEVGLFNNRVRLDATYYRNLTQDQILAVPTSETTGFGAFLTNVGEVSNTGIELELGLDVIRSKDFSWDLDMNFTTNEFRVEDLGPLENITLATGFSSLGVRAIEGGELELFGTGYARVQDENGNDIDDQLLLNADGLRTAGNERNFGSIFPDFTAGLTSVFRYKQFSLSTTFDMREGGVMFSNTVGALRRAGLAEETAVNGRADIIDNGFVLDGDGNAVANTIGASPESYWNARASATIPEGNIFDAGFIKWRELSLTYTFTKESLENVFIEGLTIGVQGRNLAIFNSDVPHIDPEASLGGAGSQLQGVERGGIPGARSIGLNLNMTF